MSLWSTARFDSDGPGNDGGNTDEDPDTFSTGFSPNMMERGQIALGRETGLDLSELVSIRVAAGPLAPLAFAGYAARGLAEEAGIDVQDPTTNGMQDRNPGDLFRYVSETPDVELLLSEDETKKIDNASNFALRRDLAAVYDRAVASFGQDRFDRPMAQADRAFMQEVFGDVHAMDEDDWDWGQPSNVRRFLARTLSDENFAPYSVVDVASEDAASSDPTGSGFEASVGEPVYTPDVTNDMQIQPLWFGSETSGGTDAPDLGSSGSIEAALEQLLSSIEIPDFEIPELDLSFLDIPEATHPLDAIGQSTGKALEEDDLRNDLRDHKIRLDRRPSRTSVGLNYDIGSGGINFL